VSQTGDDSIFERVALIILVSHSLTVFWYLLHEAYVEPDRYVFNGLAGTLQHCLKIFLFTGPGGAVIALPQDIFNGLAGPLQHCLKIIIFPF